MMARVTAVPSTSLISLPCHLQAFSPRGILTELKNSYLAKATPQAYRQSSIFPNRDSIVARHFSTIRTLRALAIARVESCMQQGYNPCVREGAL